MDILVRHTTNFNPRRLTRTIFVVRTVVLVDDNGILNFGHDGMLEKNIPYKTIAWSPPSFDSQPILSTDKCNGFNCHILHPWLHKVLPQTTNAARNRTQTHPRLSPIFIAACIDIVYNIIILSYAKDNFFKITYYIYTKVCLII